MALATILGGAGCGPDKQPAAAPPPPPRVTVAAPPAAATTGAAQKAGVNAGPNDPIVRIDAAASSEAQLASLNFALNMWMERRGRAPTNLNALVSEKLIDRIPSAPAGKRFAVDPKKNVVVLMDQ